MPGIIALELNSLRKYLYCLTVGFHSVYAAMGIRAKTITLVRQPRLPFVERVSIIAQLFGAVTNLLLVTVTASISPCR